MRRLAALAVVAVVVVVMVAAQLVLPSVAEHQLSDKLSASGQVLEVKVHAFPAIELLWHHADRVVIRMAQYHSSTGHLGGLLEEAGDAGSIDASAGVLHAGLLTVRDATLRKRGNSMTGTATVTEADLRSSLPVLQSVEPVASGDGQLTVRGVASLLGLTATVDATVRAQNGTLVVVPDLPLGGLATITVFKNPHLAIQGVGASTAPGGFAVNAQATLR